MDAQTATLLTGSLRDALTRADPLAALAELGWDEVTADYPQAATTMLFTEHGRTMINSRVLDTVVLAALGQPGPTGAVVYPNPTDDDRPASTRQEVDGVLLGPLDGVDDLVIPTSAGDVVVAAARGLTVEPIMGFDRDLCWHLVRGPIVAPRVVVSDGWPVAVAAARRALAAEMIGTATAALTLAREHTTARTQFGRSIASFQAVRHRLAESHVALCAASAVLDAAWADGGSWAAMVAKAEAGRAQETVSRHVTQVCGAIGLSQEHPLHRHVCRGAVLDTLLGGHRILEPAIGAALLDGGELPRLVGI